MAGALHGILVVSLEQAVAAPYATRLMADAGARVIKIERREGDFARGYDDVANGLSSYFVWLNRGKESIALDVKDARERDLVEAMVARADVFVENLAPGGAARLGLGAAELRRRYPRLVTCSISGYGEEGPYAGRRAYDLILQAETGLAAVTGTPDAPGRVGVSVCDIATGATAYSSVLEALMTRARTGAGGHVALSLFDVIAEWMTVPYLHARYGAGDPRRIGLAHPSIAPYGTFPTRGAPVLLSIQNEREWRRFCAIVLDDAALADDPRFVSNVMRVKNRDAVDAIVADRFTAVEREALTGLLQQASIAFGTVSSVSDLVAHPQLRRQAVATETGAIEVPVPAGREADNPPARVPACDADGERLRREFGRAALQKAGGQA